MSPFVLELIGWTASALFMVAYYLVSSKKLDGAGKPYNLMNLTGAFIYGFYAIKKDAMPLLVLEIFWGLIVVVALYRIFFRSNNIEGNA